MECEVQQLCMYVCVTERKSYGGREHESEEERARESEREREAGISVAGHEA